MDPQMAGMVDACSPASGQGEKRARTSAPLRLLHVLAPAPFGGLETVVESLAAEQARAGHDVHVAAVLPVARSTHPLLEALESKGVFTHALRVEARAYWREVRMTRELCLRIRPHALHTHGYRSDVLLDGVARRLGIASVATVHGFTGGDWKNHIYQRLQRRSYRRMDAVVAVSRPLAADLAASNIAPHRLHVIPNAWANPISFLERTEARRVLGIASTAKCIGFIGRISHEKGPDVFLDALEKAGSEYEGVLIGDGDMRRSLIDRTAALGMASSVKWAGMIENASRLIRAFDLIVLSSRTEGTPMVLLEAMAAGIPVVATRVGGIPDMLSHLDGLLVAPDAPALLAEAMRDGMTNREAARLRAAHASARVHTEFSAATWRERYDHVYHSCLARAEADHD